MDAVFKALIHRYIKDDRPTPNVDAPEVISYLKSLKQFSDSDTLKATLAAEKPDWVVPDEVLATLLGVDHCCKLIFNLSDLEPWVDSQLRQAIPLLAAQILEDPQLALEPDAPLFTILDSLNQGFIGWSADLGAGSNKLKQKLEDTIAAIHKDDTDLAALATDVSSFITKESNRIGKLEQRLAASETGLVRSKQAKIIAANMINSATNGKLVTASLEEFLHGPWYDSVQLLLNHKGVESEEWQRIEKLTETILWTYQPIDQDAENVEEEKQRLYRIIEHLPSEIRTLLVSIAHNTDTINEALEAIESDHVSIISGTPLDYEECEAIPSEAPLNSRSTVSSFLLKKVRAMETGQWYTYTDKKKSQHFKLVLKLDDVHQLLFTNRNGMKVMQKSFDEFAYYLSSHIVRQINQETAFSSAFNSYFEGVVEEHKRHQKLIAERRAYVDQLDEERKKAREKALREAKQLAAAREEADRDRQEAEKAALLAAAKSVAEQTENVEQVENYKLLVKRLSTGAFLKLPTDENELAECKLAVRIASANRMIFVDRNGTKVGDYTEEQLVQLLVAGQAEISDTGVEFEDTLAQVVTKLRQDRTKSYDDLTGA